MSSVPPEGGRSRGRGRAGGRASGEAKQQPQQETTRRPAQPPAAQVPPPAQRGATAPSMPTATGRASHRGAALDKPGDPKSLEKGMEQLSMGEGVTQAGARGGYRGINVGAMSTLLPSTYNTKLGKTGEKINLVANYFPILSSPNWCIYQYHIEFKPDIEGIRLRKALVGAQREVLGNGYIFDGMHLFMATRLQQSPLEVYSKRNSDNENIQLSIRLVKELAPTSTPVLQIMNILQRKNMNTMKYQLVGRQYFDSQAAITIPQHKMELWPGIVTAIARHETRLLMCTDLSFKAIRKDTVLNILYDIYNRDSKNYVEGSKKLLLGAIVMTTYNNKTYRIDDVDWDKNIECRFKGKDDNERSLKEYYKTAWNIDLQDNEQPLLVSRPKKREMTGEVRGPLFLIPELCCMTGLTDDMRADYNVTRDLDKHTKLGPSERVNALRTFINRMGSNAEVCKDMREWGMEFAKELVQFEGRVMGPERIHQGTVNFSYEIAQADWTNSMRSNRLHSTRNLEDWFVICTQRDRQKAEEFVKTMFKVCPKMGMNLSQPQIVALENDRVGTYIQALKTALKQNRDFAVIIVSNNKKDRYDAIKSVCCLEIPIPSQVIVSRTIGNPAKLMSIVTKIGIQINCKMGGEAWACEIPVKNSMVVGYDTYHDSSRKGLSVGALVCSNNATMTTFHSGVCFMKAKQELGDAFGSIFRSGLAKYNQKNGRLPERVFVYRDGVGDGQLGQVKEYEIDQIKQVFHQIYGEQPNWPKLTFIVVNKRINTRIFAKDRAGKLINPPPSSVVDSEITRPERWDFFLISQSVRQGTVGPTQYVILDDNSGLQPDHLQRLSYKMTHLYYNWPGTIRVPAPCQYAHKLAFLVGQSLHNPPCDVLADTLYYL